MDGYLLVDKPAGISSFRVVSIVRKLLTEQVGHKVKVGHTGTLDPMATGLLILVIGGYTKRSSEFSKLDKTYQAELTLGAISSTGDREGELGRKSEHRPSGAEVKTVLNKFLGQIWQTPQAFSAIKVGGQRAYKLARAGKQVVIKPRQVTIYKIKDVDYKYPKVSFSTSVSSGTYIRSLAEDIGAELGTGAYLSDLRRVSVGDFHIFGAQTLAELETARAPKINQALPNHP